MNFKLNFTIKSPDVKINYTDNLFFVGSCFSENIAQLFQKHYFQCVSNPHGIIFNPESILKSLYDVLECKQYGESEIIHHNEQWKSLHHHGQFSNSNKTSCLKEINNSIQKAHTQLKQSNWLFITLGSAHAYRHLASNTIVANCHKIPAAEFEKILLSKDNVIDDYSTFIKSLQQINPNIRIVFTVSPVRYTRDGLVENNLSKSILLQSVHELVAANSGCYYFPSYEIVNDELRDYRFFKEDMVHPNDLAISYIWERIQESWINEDTLAYLKEISAYIKLINHRVLNVADKEKHVLTIESYKTKLLLRYPEIGGLITDSGLLI